MSHLFIIFFSLIPASGRYIGDISKLALISVKIHFSIGKLWARIEIPISAQLSIKSIFSNLISIGYWQNFTLGPVLYSNLHLVYCQMGNFHYFPHCLTHWLLKPWHFAKFHYLPTKICHFLNVSK